MAKTAKDRFLDIVDDLRQEAEKLLQDFKEQTVYFKAKVAVLAGYVVIAVVSFIVVPPPSEDNPLDARVKVSSINFGSREKTYVEIKNESGSQWDSATITIEGTFIPPGGTKPSTGVWSLSDRWRRNEKKELFPEKFRDNRGLPPEIDVRVSRVIVEVEGVKYFKQLGKKGGT